MERDSAKILMCEWGELGSEAIRESFQKMGYRIERFYNESNNHDYDENYLSEFAEKMKIVKPDMVFSINFLPIVSKVCQIFHVVYISWIYDSPELHLYSSALSNSVNRIFIFDRMEYERFHNVSPDTVFYMPLATKPMTEEEQRDIESTEKNLYSHEVCFVGSLYDEKDRRYHEFDKLPDYWRGYIHGIVEAQLNVFGYNFIADSLSDQDVVELKNLLHYVLVDDYRNADREIIADTYIGLLCSMLDRKRTLERLTKSHLVTLYTKSDTANMENVDNRGLADPILVTPKIFHCSKINLNITSKTIQTGIPLRVFDVLGCGGFLITNYQAELCEYFEPGVDLVVYEDLADLEQKVDYYLAHEEERKQIAANGYKRVCENYTYDIMLKKIMMNVLFSQ
jgi:spore maturation protein CgeB